MSVLAARITRALKAFGGHAAAQGATCCFGAFIQRNIGRGTAQGNG